MLDQEDIEQIEAHGLTLDKVMSQLQTFNKGIPFVDVVTSATLGNGIQSLDQAEKEKYDAYFEAKKSGMDLVKFVPASGAATRMFKFLHEFLNNYDPEKEHFRDYIKKHPNEDVTTFFESATEFAFINNVRKVIREQYPDYKQSPKGKRHHYFAKAMLSPEGLNFSNLPKGLIPFHRYKKYATTAFEEQLYESAYYASANDDVYLHFTFTEAHLDAFKAEFASIKNRVSKKTKRTFHISYSFQKSSTDTLAVTPDNKPFRNKEGKLVFRPSGHGALLENLNDIDADVVFIKNIDNVAAQEYAQDIATNKRILAGRLMWLQNKIFGFLRDIENDLTLEKMKEIQTFIWKELDVKDIPHGVTATVRFLNRPLRVCGVVKNTGAPGGGPFWVKSGDDEVSLQIVESSQVDKDNPHQRAVLMESTHFNPVDVICGLRDYKGQKFDLMKFCDMDQGFISEKSEDGSPIRALELPGLWNGGMANWNTVFVEVPLSTFNPVKTVNDLLKKEHRPNA